MDSETDVPFADSGSGSDISQDIQLMPTEFHRDVSLSPIQPENAFNPVRDVRDGRAGSAAVENTQWVQGSVEFHDAVSTGYLLHSPVSFRIVEVDGDYSVETDSDTDNRVINIETTESDAFVDVHTLWDITFPKGHCGYVTRPFIFTDNSFPLLPDVIGDNAKQNELILRFRADEELYISKGEPIAQLIPMGVSDPAIGSRAFTEEENTTLQHEERRREIYPEVYTQERFRPWSDSTTETARNGGVGTSSENTTSGSEGDSPICSGEIDHVVFPKHPPEKYRDDNPDIEFIAEQQFIDVLAPVEHSEAFVEAGVKNYQYQRDLGQDVQDLVEASRSKTAYSRGYILPNPYHFSIVEDDGSGALTISMVGNDETMFSFEPSNICDGDLAVNLHLQWAVTGADDYLLFFVHPGIVPTDKYELMPMLVDPGVGLSRLTLPIRIKEGGIPVYFGDPLAQVIPIRKDSVTLGIDIEMPSSRVSTTEHHNE